MRVAIDENQGAHPLGMGGREVDLGHAGVPARQCRSLECHRVQHRRQVSIRDVAGQGRSWVTLRRAHAPRVEPHGATEGLQPPAKTDKTWIVGQEIDWNRDRARRPVRVARPRSSGRRDWSHRLSGRSGSQRRRPPPWTVCPWSSGRRPRNRIGLLDQEQPGWIFVASTDRRRVTPRQRSESDARGNSLGRYLSA